VTARASIERTRDTRIGMAREDHALFAGRTQALLALAWLLAVALRLTFGFEVVSVLGCTTILVDAGLCIAPPFVWFFLVVERRVRWVHHAMLLAAVLVLAVAVRNVHEWQARSFLWRREATLLEQIDSLRDPTRVLPSSPLSRPLRVEREPFRVYWPCADHGLGSAGLVWDPAATLVLDANAFGESVIRVTHLSGPWFLCGFT
jgi:hypothetical protein